MVQLTSIIVDVLVNVTDHLEHVLGVVENDDGIGYRHWEQDLIFREIHSSYLRAMTPDRERERERERDRWREREREKEKRERKKERGSGGNCALHPSPEWTAGCARPSRRPASAAS